MQPRLVLHGVGQLFQELLAVSRSRARIGQQFVDLVDGGEERTAVQPVLPFSLALDEVADGEIHQLPDRRT